MEIERISAGPDFPSLQTIAPVFTVISSFCSLTRTTVFGAPGFPFCNVNRRPLSSGNTAAWPVHLIEPSGQYASGHVCKYGAFSEAMTAVSPFCSTPFAQGTPQVTPPNEAGALFSHFSSACAFTSVPPFCSTDWSVNIFLFSLLTVNIPFLLMIAGCQLLFCRNHRFLQNKPKKPRARACGDSFIL